ncbi:8658_t:CDS:1, partial [Gigaspora rosea]
SNRHDLNPQAISIAKNISLIIQPICPSLDNLNPAIREFHTLTKARIPKNI